MKMKKPHNVRMNNYKNKEYLLNEILKVINLTKYYDDFLAVDKVNFDVKQAEIFGFLGPNGAGKTSTINMLIGMAKISSGNVIYKGEDLTKKIKKAQKLIGIVPDESNLYDEMSGYENLCFCGSIYGMKKKEREARALELLEDFQLKDAANKRFKAYSKGMKRKLTIASALMHKPEILFLDEPTTGIDVVSVRQIRNMIKELNKSGTTVFMTTHYIEEAERLCNRVAFINKGKIVKLDSVANLIHNTQDSHVLEIVFEPVQLNIKSFIEKLKKNFEDIECSLKDETCIKIVSNKKLDISPVVSTFSQEGFYILEAKLIKPSLEDAFVKFTGIDINQMKKEKEKK